MHRRQYLALGGTLFSAGLAGCSEDEPAEMDEEAMESAYRAELESRDISIDHIGVATDRIIMDYSTTTTSQDELIREMGDVTFGYAEILTPGWQVELAEIWINDPTVEDPAQRAMASYLVQNEWAFQWQSNEITDNELMELVLETVEISEQFTDRYGDS